MSDLELDLGLNDDEPKEEQLKTDPTASQKINSSELNLDAGKKSDTSNFEDSLKRLETIVEQMEKGELSLEDCMKHFEEGTKLANFCTAKLEETEKKIEILVNRDGKKEWTALDNDIEAT